MLQPKTSGSYMVLETAGEIVTIPEYVITRTVYIYRNAPVPMGNEYPNPEANSGNS